jgi:signal transduction histidine kinase
MKLIERTGRSYLILSLVIFMLFGIVLYFILTAVMNNRLDESLRYNKEVISKRIKYDTPLTIFEEPEELTPSENLLYPNDTIVFKDTLIFHAIEGLEGVENTEEYEKYRQLTAYETLQGRRYKIIARNSLVRNQDFVTIITLLTIFITLLLVAGLWFFNTRTANKIWKPFYKNLNNLKNFSVQDQKPIQLQSSNIDEFMELNGSIKSLTEKLSSDYNNLKEFTENASHEMQTPLAIMQSKIELLLQSTNLNESEIKQLTSIYQAGQRLSKLNKTLLTLAKVENRQFSEIEDVNISDLLNNKLELYDDFIVAKKLEVETDIERSIILKTNSTMVGMLITNLLSNAIRHNVEKGSIYVQLSSTHFQISNSGNELTVSPENLFNRFKKDSSSADSSGLGLAIVKKICEVNEWKIDYTFLDSQHQIIVRF